LFSTLIQANGSVNLEHRRQSFNNRLASFILTFKRQTLYFLSEMALNFNGVVLPKNNLIFPIHLSKNIVFPEKK